MTYLVANNWSGRLHIETMRSFDTITQAAAYASELVRSEYHMFRDPQAPLDRYIRVYLVTDDCPPKRIKVTYSP